MLCDVMMWSWWIDGLSDAMRSRICQWRSSKSGWSIHSKTHTIQGYVCTCPGSVVDQLMDRWRSNTSLSSSNNTVEVGFAVVETVEAEKHSARENLLEALYGPLPCTTLSWLSSDWLCFLQRFCINTSAPSNVFLLFPPPFYVSNQISESGVSAQTDMKE